MALSSICVCDVNDVACEERRATSDKKASHTLRTGYKAGRHVSTVATTVASMIRVITNMYYPMIALLISM